MKEHFSWVQQQGTLHFSSALSTHLVLWPSPGMHAVSRLGNGTFAAPGREAQGSHGCLHRRSSAGLQSLRCSCELNVW